MYVHTLNGAQAPARAGTELWTHVRIEESPDKSSIATAETQVLDPPETNPSTPVEGRVITFNSSLQTGFFRLVFIDETGDESPPTDWAVDESTGDEAWAPSPEEVAPYLRARIKTPGGGEIPTWNESTRPTRTQVQELIHLSTQDVAVQVGEVPAQLYAAASVVAGIGAAMMIEVSFYPEQIDSNRSAYDLLEKMYDKRMAALVEAAEEIHKTGEIIPGTTDEDEDGVLQSNTPSYSFDPVLRVGLRPW